MPTNRRHLLALAALAPLAAQPVGLRRAWAGRPNPSANYFDCGIASGCPDADGLVLWTRLTGLASGQQGFSGPILSIRWELSHDEFFSRVVQSGSAPALAQLGHTVHVEVRGLEPARWYWYRFIFRGVASPSGRTRTAPSPDAMPDELRFAFASCQHWEDGYYAAWRHVVTESPDMVAFLGDYIYEGASSRHSQHALARTQPLRRATTLADYRDRYALHKSDTDLQAAHRACPWIMTWDDHEVRNDYANETVVPADTDFPAQRAAAYQAFYENMPLRASALVHGLANLTSLGHAADAVRVTQRHAFGRLARFHVLDTRQFRDVQACRDDHHSSSGVVHPADCPTLKAPERTMLGAAQEQWLAKGLAADANLADGPRWSVIAQQTLFSPRHYGNAATGPVTTDTWDGYPAARQRLSSAIAVAPPRNTVFIGGDIHQNFVCNVKERANDESSKTVASEFCGTSVTSFSGASQQRLDRLVEQNPHILLANSQYRGYGLVRLTPARWTTELRILNDPMRADSGISTLARFVVEDTHPGVQHA
jgi:alkaline phosphatase D